MDVSLSNLWPEMNCSSNYEKFASWVEVWLDEKRCHVWWMAPLCLFWCIGKDCNHQIFNGEKLALRIKVEENPIRALLKWTNALLDVGILSILDFLDSRGCNCYLFIIFWLLLVVTGWFFYVWYFVYTSCIHRKDVSPWRSFNRLSLFAYQKKIKKCLWVFASY